MRFDTNVIATMAVAAIMICAGEASATPILWDAGPGNTNHWYEVVQAPSGISWNDAQADAISRGGYLATILSQEENNFVFGLIDSAAYWVGEGAGNGANLGPWLGGYQLPSSAEPGGGWTWVNGDGPFVFTNWNAGEPSNANGGTGYPESALQYFAYGGRSSFWNDLPQGDNIFKKPIAYVVEYNTLTPVPEPASLLLVGTGCLTLALRRTRRGRRRVR